MALDISRLEKVKQPGGRKIIARCPACAEMDQDRQGEHLLVNEDGSYGCVRNPGEDGKTHRQRIFELVGIRDAPSQIKPSAILRPKTILRPKARWRTLDEASAAFTKTLGMRETRRDRYRDSQGRESFTVFRFDGAQGKTFRPVHFNCLGWVPGDPPGLLPLFNLPEFQNRPAERVFIVEGEKCASELETLGVLVCTSAHGAKSGRKTDWTPLRDRDVVILPDNDNEGRAYAETVAGILRELPASSVRIVTLPSLPEKGDCVEWLEERDSIEPAAICAELDAIVESVPAIESQAALPRLANLNARIAENQRMRTAPTDGDTDSSPANRDEWPEPKSIRNELRPVQPLREDMIPKPYRAWLGDVAHRMQCPLDFVAAAAVVLTSSIIGAGCGIRPKRRDDWLVIPNLWGGAIGRPSMLKTPALAEALKPLVQLEARAKEEYDAEMREHAADVEMHEAKRVALKSSMVKEAKGSDEKRDLRAEYASLEAPQPPVWRRYKTNDSTIEKMSELLAQNPRGLLIFRDELIGLLASWEKEGRESDRAFHIEAWNGFGSNTTDRIGRGTIHTENLCEAIFGGIQPSKLTSYLHQAVQNIENDGLIQRFQLLVYPDEPKRWQLVDEYPNHEEKNRAFGVIETLAGMDFAQHGATLDEGGKAPYFRFANDAQEFFFEWLTTLENEKLRRADEEPIMIEHLGKFRSLLPSLALIFHLVEIADGTGMGAVSLRAAQQAAQWCDYLEAHARRIYGLVSDVNIQAASRLARKIEEGRLTDGFSVRDVYRKGWVLLDTPDLAQAALDELVEAGWLRQEQQQAKETGQKPLPVFRINPKVKASTS